MEDLEDTQDFDEYDLHNFFPPGTGKFFSDYECNEYVAEGGYKSNNDSYNTVHVEIP